MSMPSRLPAHALFVLFPLLPVPSALSAQQTATVPKVCTTLPGNAATSMPLRWSQGILQVFVNAQLLPANFVGETISGVRLRRSTLPGDVAYGTLTRTLTVRGGFQPYPAAQMIGGVTANRPPNAQILFGPAAVNIAATPAPGPATTVGDEFVQIQFSTPLPVTAGTLYMEFESSDTPLQIESDFWVDAVWFTGGTDVGYVVPVGDGSCTSRAEPTVLEWTSPGGPVAGTQAQLRLTGAPPSGELGIAAVWVGISPETRGPGPGYLGYGADLSVVDAAMVGCHQWAPLDIAWAGLTDGSGAFATGFQIPGAAVAGTRLAIQGGWLDASRAVIPLSFSNGLQLVCTSAGVQAHCNSLYFPGTATVSPWAPFVGQMPVLVLEY